MNEEYIFKKLSEMYGVSEELIEMIDPIFGDDLGSSRDRVHYGYYCEFPELCELSEDVKDEIFKEEANLKIPFGETEYFSLSTFSEDYNNQVEKDCKNISLTDKINQIINSYQKKELDEIKVHTTYKIKYITEYVRNWLNVAINYTNKIEFIDAMCNAGIYKKGESSTSLNVILLFKNCAINHKNKTFKVILNDYNQKRIDIYKKIIDELYLPNNLYIEFNCQDVVEFLNITRKKYKSYNSAMTLLYVDPYNFGIQDLLSTITKFVDEVYCELIYNFFSSDIKRNCLNESAVNKQKKMIREIQGFIPCYSPEQYEPIEVLYQWQNSIKKTKNIKYSFAYQFRNTKNVEQYYIVYFTPNIKGIEKLKDTIWSVFEGDSSFYFKRRLEDHTLINLFGNTEIDDRIAQESERTIKLLQQYNGHNDFTYEYLEKIVLEKTLLKESQIIKNILKPLIEKKILVKRNKVKTNNFKQDTYGWSEYDESKKKNITL